MTFVLDVDGRLIDLDDLWDGIVVAIAPHGPVGRASVALGVAIGLRLSADHPTLGAALLARLEYRMAHENLTTAEEAEVTIRDVLEYAFRRTEVVP